MIGCLLFGAGFLMMARLIRRHHMGWHHGRGAHCGPGWHGRGGYSGYGGYGFGGHGLGHGGFGGFEPANDDGFGGGGYDGDGPGFGPDPRWFRGGFRKGFVARALSERLEATPAQERVIRDATEEFREAAKKLKGEGKRTRADLATSFRKGHFDEVLFGELFARHDNEITDLRKAFIGMGARIHDALDEKQRARLADLIEAGPGAWRPRFGGRGWGHMH